MTTTSTECWQAQAACRTVDPEIFFPTGIGWAREVQVRAAKNVCATCSVTAECLASALRHGVVDGVWGGRSVEERDNVLPASAA
jgi:WhiB family redox-sensing transcriptional regulator